MADAPFGPYRLVSLIGRGGMGEVWRAVDTRKDRVVALKVLGAWLAGDEEFVARFRRESELAARLSGPHVVPIHDYGAIDGRLFIDMPLIDGVDLTGLLERDGPLPVRRAVDIAGQVAKALDAAHRAGMVHRDVKPSNILISDNGGDDFVHLIDFGIARAMDGTRHSLSGAMVGTPAYMAPERFDGGGDGRSDVYALACVLHEALTGHKPFEASTLWAYVKAHQETPPPRARDRNPAVPTALDAVIARGMAKDPTARHPTAGEFAAAARAAIETAAEAPTGVVIAPVPAQAHTPTPTPPVAAPPTVRHPPPSASPTPPPPAVPRAWPAPPRPPVPLARPPAPAPTSRRWLLAGTAAAIAVVTAVVLVTQFVRPAGNAGSGTGTSRPPPPTATTTAPPATPRSIALTGSAEGLTIAPDGRTAYAVDRDTDTVWAVDLATDTVTAQLPGGNDPFGAAVTPDGRRLYLANIGENGNGRTVTVVDLAGGTVADTVQAGAIPWDVAVSPDGRLAYAVNNYSGDVTVIETATNRVTATVKVGFSPVAVAFAPDGGRAYVACKGAVTVIDTAASRVAATIKLDGRAAGLAVTPDGDSVYVADEDNDAVLVLDTASNTVVRTVPVGGNSFDLAVTPDGRRAYVTLYPDLAQIVDLGGLTGSWPAGSRPGSAGFAH